MATYSPSIPLSNLHPIFLRLSSLTSSILAAKEQREMIDKVETRAKA